MDSHRSDSTPSTPPPASARPAVPEPARPEPAQEAVAPPTPVRRAMDVAQASPEPVERDTEEVSLDIEGIRWRVRVLGRSRGGSTAAPTDLLLLGFSRGDDGDADLERLVVGRALSGLTEHQLATALGSATPPPDPDRPGTLFQGAVERRSRKD